YSRRERGHVSRGSVGLPEGGEACRCSLHERPPFWSVPLMPRSGRDGGVALLVADGSFKTRKNIDRILGIFRMSCCGMSTDRCRVPTGSRHASETEKTTECAAGHAACLRSSNHSSSGS